MNYGEKNEKPKCYGQEIDDFLQNLNETDIEPFMRLGDGYETICINMVTHPNLTNLSHKLFISSYNLISGDNYQYNLHLVDTICEKHKIVYRAPGIIT